MSSIVDTTPPSPSISSEGNKPRRQPPGPRGRVRVAMPGVSKWSLGTSAVARMPKGSNSSRVIQSASATPVSRSTARETR